MHWVEFQNFGLNAKTFSFIGILLFLAWYAWAYYQQDKLVRDKESGKSVSVLWFACFGCFQLVGGIYGWDISSLTLVLNGIIRGLMNVPILIGLWRHKGFRPYERVVVSMLVAAVLATWWIPDKQTCFLVISFGVLVALASQSYEIWKNRDAGAVDVRLLLFYLSNSTFWLVYSSAIGDAVLISFNLVFIALTLLNLFLWRSFRPQK